MTDKIYFYRISKDYEDGTEGYTISTNVPNFAGDTKSKLEELAKNVLDQIDKSKHLDPISVEIKFQDAFEK
jgi:hypothetical protein